jgi:hypothetical protein
MALAGSLRQVALPEVLRSVEGGQRTGKLTIERAPLRAEIYFGGGQWLLLERSGDTAPIAHHLAQNGLITPQQFQAATGLSLAQAGMMPDMQSIRLLINARTLTQEELRGWFQRDAVSLLMVVLGWPDGDFAFEDGAQVPPGRVVFPLPITPLVGQAMQTLRGGSLNREVAPLSPDTVIDFAEVDPRATSSVHISREQWRLLTMVDGQMPLWAIAQALQAPEHVILQLAGELASLGIVAVVGSVSPASTQPFA